jgi:hypothetical protein
MGPGCTAGAGAANGRRGGGGWRGKHGVRGLGKCSLAGIYRVWVRWGAGGAAAGACAAGRSARAPVCAGGGGVLGRPGPYLYSGAATGWRVRPCGRRPSAPPGGGRGRRRQFPNEMAARGGARAGRHARSGGGTRPRRHAVGRRAARLQTAAAGAAPRGARRGPRPARQRYRGAPAPPLVCSSTLRRQSLSCFGSDSRTWNTSCCCTSLGSPSDGSTRPQRCAANSSPHFSAGVGGGAGAGATPGEEALGAARAMWPSPANTHARGWWWLARPPTPPFPVAHRRAA